jgi:Leucine-rich repeat (LRR) protein
MQILYQFLAYTRSWVIPPIIINFAVEINTLYKIRNFIYVTKLRIHNNTAKAALKFESEAWVLKKREEQRLETAQMKFLGLLPGITKLDIEKNQYIRGKKQEQRI